MWLDLQERFSHVNVIQLFNIENEIHNCVQGNMSMGSYFTKLKGLWDERGGGGKGGQVGPGHPQNILNFFIK
jgi:hypothetical protein